MSAEFIERRMPRPRKITLAVILSMAFTNSVLLVVTLVRPVPQFSSSGTLMTISARGNATLGKRDLSHDDFEGGKYFFDLFDSILERRRDHNEMEQDDEDKDLYLITQDSEEIDMTEDPNIFETMINSNNSRSSEPNDLRTDLYFPETETSSLTIRTHSETITTTSSISTLVPEQSTAIPKQHEKGKIVKINKSRPTNNGWVELWIGPLGVCIQRRNGTIACSTASLTKNFLATYKQAGLNDEIIARLPHHLKGCPVALLMAALTYIVCTGIFAITLSPPFSLLMRYGPNKSMDSRHQISLALNTILSTISMFLVLIPTFILRNMFLKILNSIPAFDNNLKAILSGSFIQLYTCSILGALILLQSMVLVSEDLRKPWWFVYNTLRRNPFQTNTRGIDFTAHKQLKRQAEAQARAEAQAQALAQTVRQQYGVARSGYDGQGDRISEYAPTGIGPSEIAPPGGSVFISTRRPTRLGGTGTATSGPPYDYTFPPRPTERPYGATSIASSAYPHMYRRDSGVVIPSMAVHTRPGSPEFPAKGW